MRDGGRERERGMGVERERERGGGRERERGPGGGRERERERREREETEGKIYTRVNPILPPLWAATTTTILLIQVHVLLRCYGNKTQ